MRRHLLPILPTHLTGRPEGMALQYGRYVATVRSKKTGQHVTIRFTAKRPPVGEESRWKKVPFAESTRVYADVPRGGDLLTGDSPGYYDMLKGEFVESRGADPARVWAALFALRAAAGFSLSDKADIEQSVRCFTCGRELTDPESIERGIGPVCFGRATESIHQSRHAAQQVAAQRRSQASERRVVHGSEEASTGFILGAGQSARAVRAHG